jgi:hypothetical protein
VQMTVKYTDIFNSKDLPKFTQIWIFWFENIPTIWQPCCKRACQLIAVFKRDLS